MIPSGILQSTTPHEDPPATAPPKVKAEEGRGEDEDGPGETVAPGLRPGRRRNKVTKKAQSEKVG